MRRLVIILFTIILALPIKASWYYSINIDYETTAAITAAYAAQYATEALTQEEVKKILDHYTTAEVASAGIFASKWLDRKALKNAGRFSDAQANYYYKRIYFLVSQQIMPKIFSVALLCVKQPEKAVYWGPYLYKVTEDVKALCQQFEVVVTNGKLTFQDIAFYTLSDQFKQLFDLAQLGNVDWKSLFEKIGDFGSGLTKEDFMSDLNGLVTLGSSIASAGGGVATDAWSSMSGSAKNCLNGGVEDIHEAYHNFKDMYETFSNPANIKDLVMQKLASQDSTGVMNLLTVDGYNIGRYISDYVTSAQGQYYKQTWYIQNVSSGSEDLFSYTPSEYGKPDDRTKGGEYYYQEGSVKSSNFDEMVKQTSENYTGWSRQKIKDLNSSQSGSQNPYKYYINVYPYYSGYWYRNGNKDDVQGYYGAASIYAYRTWNWKTIVYQETFDSYDQNINVFLAKMNAKLNEYNTNQTTPDSYGGQSVNKDADNPIVYQLVAGEKQYYTESDEKKMQGCASVSYTLNCDGENNLGEGQFQWKVNGDHHHWDIRDDSKEYAMETTLSSGSPDTQEIDSKISDLNSQKSSLESQINSLKERNKELLSLISSASVADAATYRSEYNSNQTKINDLQTQLDSVNSSLTEAQNDRQAIIDDYNDELDGEERIPSIMHQLEVAYKITWDDEGHWEGATFVRTGTVPSMQNGHVKFTGELSCIHRCTHPWYSLGIRLTRTILQVKWALKADYSSSSVIEVMELDASLSDAEKNEKANQRLHDLQNDYPDCVVEMEYAYQAPQEVDGDDDEIHLLWISDRLQIARNIEYRLSRIYANLLLTEKFLRQRDSILDYFKREVFGGLPEGSRQTWGGKAFRRWRHAAAHIAAGNKPEDIEISEDDL